MFNTHLSSILGELNSVSSSFFLSENLLPIALGIIALVGVIIYFVNQNKVKLPQNITEQAKSLQETIEKGTGEMNSIAQEKINSILEEYKRLLPYLEELGLNVEGFSIEAGLLPQINTSLRGSIDDIKNEAIERIKEENKTNTLFVAILNAISMAKNCHEQLESVYISILKDIIIDIKLGVPPAISVRFQ